MRKDIERYKCPECGVTSFKCSICNSDIPLKDFVDIFHIGICPNCGHIAEPCPERVKQ